MILRNCHDHDEYLAKVVDALLKNLLPNSSLGNNIICVKLSFDLLERVGLNLHSLKETLVVEEQS